ncbi:MAG: efflux RND transporter periplasmic adaptor subunit [Phycisphaerae bacterium]|nr:efflux RND transporter periplasmic adaptor subunit [Phycisphaerae bacterium]
MLRKFLVSLPLIVLALGGGLAIAVMLVWTKPPPITREASKRATRVKAYAVVPQTVQETLVGYGTARPDELVTLSAQVGGEVVEIAKGLEDGSEIKKDQLLVRLQEEDYKQQLARAQNLIKADEATLEEIELERDNLKKLIKSGEQDVRITQDEYTRVSGLFEKDAAAKREFDLMRSALLKVTSELDNLKTRLAVLDPKTQQTMASMAAHKAEVALAKLSLERCRIVAPFDGRLRRRQVEVGETVAPGRPLMIVLKLDRIEVPIELAASCAMKVRPGSECTLAVESLPEMSWSGRVQRLGPAADEQSRTITAYVVVDNAKQPTPLLPGLFVRAEVAGPVHLDALAIPRGAIRGGVVFVAKDGKAWARPVELECALKDTAVVRKGIDRGDTVILTNLASLSDQMPVEVELQGHELANSRHQSSPTTLEATGMP